jgi:hypothetical protein
MRPSRHVTLKLSILIFSLIFLGFKVVRASAAPPDFDRNLASNTCSEKWTKRGELDSKMFDYCMEQQTEGFEDTLQLYSKYKKINDIDAIVAFAAEKWLKRSDYQYEMVAFEIKKQTDAILDLAYDLKAGKYSEAEVGPCVQKWVDSNEPQWDMVVYCLKK